MTSRRRLALVLVWGGSVALAFELAGRTNFFVHHHLPFATPASQLAYRFYPNLKDVMSDERTDRVRVIVFGASALNPGWSDFAVELEDRLSALLGREVRIFNTSMAAQTSRDSYFKYAFLRSRPFHLVILYNSINELRANNVPDELWQDDYAHYAWYDEVNFYFRHPELARWWTILPFYVKHLSVVLDRKVINKHRKAPYNNELSRQEWLAFGAKIKSARSLRQNLEATLALARAKGEPVLLMTYAYYLPPDYSLERFQQGTLGYARWEQVRGSEVEIWGRPENVRKGLEVHNEVIREVAKQDGVLFVDQQALLGDSPNNFVDVCHLSPEGMRRFVDSIIAELARRDFHAEPPPRDPLQAIAARVPPLPGAVPRLLRRRTFRLPVMSGGGPP